MSGWASLVCAEGEVEVREMRGGSGGDDIAAGRASTRNAEEDPKATLAPPAERPGWE